MADEQNPILDQSIPTPGPITLTFDEAPAPEASAASAPEAPAAPTPADQAADALAQAQDALSQAKDVLSDVENAAGATLASNGISVGAAQAPAPATGASLSAAMAQAPAAPGASFATGAAQNAASAAQDTSVAFSAEEQAQIDAFAERIDLHNSNAIMQYGAGTQKKMSDFSDLALENVKNKDMGEVGKMISGLVTELTDFDVKEDDGGIFKFFKKQTNKLVAMKAKYEKTEKSVDDIVRVLEGHQVQLLKDVATLDKMYDMNLQYFKELSMYIAAGKKRLAEVRNGELKQLQEKAAASGDAQDAQAAKDLGALCRPVRRSASCRIPTR